MGRVKITGCDGFFNFGRYGGVFDTKIQQQFAVKLLIALQPVEPFGQLKTRQGIGKFWRIRFGFTCCSAGSGLCRGLSRCALIWRLDPFLQGTKQLIRIDRFGDMPVHAGLQAFFFITGHGMGRHGDNR